MIEYVRTLLLFYRRHLRVQPLRELMAVAGVAAGVTLLFAVQVAHRSITGSFEEIAHGVAGRATVEVASRGPEGFSEHVAEAVEKTPGVEAAAPIFQQPVVVVGPEGRRALTLVGANEQIVPFGGRLSLAFERAAEASKRGLLVLTERTARAIGAKPGSEVAVLVGARTEHLAVDSIVPSDKIGPLAESPVAAAPLPVVQNIAGFTGRATRVLVEPSAGHEAALRRSLRKRFGATLNVRSIDTEAALLGNAAAPEQQVTLLFGAISLVAGVILAYNALLLASDERRRFIVYLIETGTRDSMIVASLAFDAFILGLAGSLLGLLAGDGVSLFAFRTAPGYITAAFAVGAQRVVSPQTVIVALAGGMLAAFAAAALPAVIALRGGAAAEPEAVGRSLSFARKLRVSDAAVFACGASLVCVSVVVSVLKPTATVAALVVLAAGLVLCLPMILHRLLSVAHTVVRRSGDASARLAIAELRESPGRSVALLATGTIAVFLMVLIGGAVSDVQHAVRRGAADVLSDASIWVKPGGPENVYTTQPFAYAETQRRLQALPIVSSVLPWRDSFLDLPGRRVWVLGVPPELPAQIAPSQLIEGSLATADERIRDGGWAAVSETIARERHLHLGERFNLPTPSGFATFRLAATVANYGWLPGTIVMNADEHARLWRSATASQLAVTLEPGVSVERGRRTIEGALPRGSALTAQSGEERRSEVDAVLASTLARLNDTTIVVLITAVASVIALMIAAIWQRRGRLDALISIGMSASQLARLTFYESGAVLLCGCSIGFSAGIAGQYLIDSWLQRTTGSPVRFDPALPLGLRTIVLAASISFLAAAIVGLKASRFAPRMALSTK